MSLRYVGRSDAVGRRRPRNASAHISANHRADGEPGSFWDFTPHVLSQLKETNGTCQAVERSIPSKFSRLEHNNVSNTCSLTHLRTQGIFCNKRKAAPWNHEVTRLKKQRQRHMAHLGCNSLWLALHQLTRCLHEALCKSRAAGLDLSSRCRCVPDRHLSFSQKRIHGTFTHTKVAQARGAVSTSKSR